MAFNPNDHMRTVQGGQQYLDVKYRLVWLRDADIGKPEWGIRTTMLYQGPLVKGQKGGWNAEKTENLTRPGVIFYAEVTDENGRVIGSGHGSETADDFSEFYEKAETKAIGRALAVAGFGTQFAAELDDEDEQIVDSPVVKVVKDFTPNTDNTGPVNTAKLPTVSQDTAGKCEQCGDVITGYTRPGGAVLSAAEVAAKTKANTGKALCRVCGAKASKPAK